MIKLMIAKIAKLISDNENSIFSMKRSQAIVALMLGMCHIFLFTIFLGYEVYFMCVINILNIGFLYLAYTFTKKKHILIFFYTIFAGIMLFIIAGTVLIGNEFGFSNYCFVILTAIFYCAYGFKNDLEETHHFKTRLLSVIDIIVFLGVILYGHFLPPITMIQAPHLHVIINLFNIGISMCISLIFLADFYKKITDMEYSLKKINMRLDHIAKSDPLTGLHNRRNVDDFLQKLQLSNMKFALIMSDMDDFKKINDNYGHECGDIVLKRIALIMKNNVRGSDVICRWGGEEILIVLPACGQKEARRVGEKIRKEIEKAEIIYNNKKIQVTVTMGICESKPGLTSDEMIGIADQMLYVGKQRGKNCVVV